jgi:hypothetical protein
LADQRFVDLVMPGPVERREQAEPRVPLLLEPLAGLFGVQTLPGCGHVVNVLRPLGV